MKTLPSQNFITLDPSDTLQLAVDLFGSENKPISGLILIVNSNSEFIGLLNSSDVLRLIASGISLDSCLIDLIKKDPIIVYDDFTEKQLIEVVKNTMKLRTKGRKSLTRYVPILSKEKKLKGVADVFEILANLNPETVAIEIYGMGFVGLTLANVLAARGNRVYGIDTNSKIIESLSKGMPSIHEPNLPDVLKINLKNDSISFSDNAPTKTSPYVIIAVGTPISDDGSVNLSYINSVINVVGKRLKRNDLVMLRSTVPVGSTRSLILELEKLSGLTAGIEFHVAFTPERTVEGNALSEVTSLPQIVGGYSKKCTEVAVKFWQRIANNVVTVDSLEAAELVKLINNSFRDLSFAFSNGVSLLCDKYNIDATRLILSANEGYPRNPIPKPSPGVGGYCLTKDPFLYASIHPELPHSELSKVGRKLNENIVNYPVQKFLQFCREKNLSPEKLNVCFLGMAFKGFPETNDLRGSTSVSIAKAIKKLGCKVFAFDNVVSHDSIEALGFEFSQPQKCITDCNALFILNNNPRNIPENLSDYITKKPFYIFDGWSMLDLYTYQSDKNITYTTLGYNSNNEQTN